MTNTLSPLWDHECRLLLDALSSVAFHTCAGEALPPDRGFARLEAMLLVMKGRGGNLYCIGNGASSTICSHFAADLNKNAAVRTQVFTDAALLTAISNDISFERVYAEILRRQAQPGDMLLTVSSSGNSPNILAAIAEARSMGIEVVTLSAMSADNACRRLGDVNVYVPVATYGLAESAHACILHHLIDRLVAALRCNSEDLEVV